MVKRDKKRPEKVVAAAPPRARTPFDRRHALLGVVILIALFTYANSFRAPFLMDNAEILNDTRLHAATSENVDRILKGPYYQSVISGLYRPFTSLTYLYNYAVRGDGANASGYHSFNFLLHAVNIALVYLLGLILFEQIPAALALSALWGVHPVLTEAVTNIVGRADMLAAFGVLASVVGCHYALRTEGWKRFLLLGAVAAASLIGAFSKEIGIVAPAGVLLYDLLYARGESWRRRAAGYAAVVAPAVVFLVVRARVIATLPVGPFPYLDNPLLGGSFVEGRMTAFKVLGKYAGLLLWPATLSPDYSYNEIAVRVDALGIVSLAGCLAAAALAIWAWRSHRALTFSIALFFVGIAPVANVFLLIGSIMGERFLYLPSVGFMAAVVYGLNRLWTTAPQRRTAIAAALGLVLLVMAGRARERNEDWNDDRRFWAAAVEAVPGSFRPHSSIVATIPRSSAEGWQRAVSEAQRALDIVDKVPDERNAAFPYRNAGVLYRAYGDHLASANDAMGASQWRQRSLDVLLRSERIERKLDEQYRAINGARGFQQSTYLPAVIYRELGITYLKLNATANALRTLEFGRTLESDPELLENLAAAYESVGELRKAAQALVEALEVDSRRSQIAERLLGLYKRVDPAGCAVQRDAGGESLNITCPMVQQDLCGAAKNVAHNYLRRNQTAEAASIRRVAMSDLGCPASALE